MATEGSASLAPLLPSPAFPKASVTREPATLAGPLPHRFPYSIPEDV